MLKQKLLKTEAFIDNEYLDKYIQLIENNLDRPIERFYTQIHHIIPKHVIEDNSAENKVNLLYSDHLLAHYYLMKCSATSETELANANAIFRNTNNPHSPDIENWLIKNADLLQEINKRRCELISLHHIDVSGVKNPRAVKVYQYNTEGKLELIHHCVKYCSEYLNINSDSLRTMLSRNKILFINEVVLSKSADITEQEILDCLAAKNYRASRQRKEYSFICENCGKEYTLLLAESDYQKRLLTKHYCYACTKSGITFRGIAKSEEQKKKMSEAFWRRQNLKKEII